MKGAVRLWSVAYTMITKKLAFLLKSEKIEVLLSQILLLKKA